MIFYFTTFILSWLVFLFIGDSKLWRCGVVAGLVGLLQEVVGLKLGLWSYDNSI